MTNFDNVTKINYKNEVYDIAGENVVEIIALLDIDESKVSMEVENDTLYIIAKTGTKGNK